MKRRTWSYVWILKVISWSQMMVFRCENSSCALVVYKHFQAFWSVTCSLPIQMFSSGNLLIWSIWAKPNIKLSLLRCLPARAVRTLLTSTSLNLEFVLTQILILFWITKNIQKIQINAFPFSSTALLWHKLVYT